MTWSCAGSRVSSSTFDGYAAVLVQLPVAGVRAVREALADAWSAKAPARLRDS